MCIIHRYLSTIAIAICHYSSTIVILVLVALSNTASCTVYTVTADDHYYPNTTCHHCHNLQHYLLNITKYFTSNTQLLFLPGLHHLHTDLIIQNVHNISLIGSTANGTTLDTVIIQCNSSVGITITNITNLTMAKFVIENCKIENNFLDIDSWIFRRNSMILSHCYNVQLQNITVHRSESSDQLYRSAVLAINILGISSFINLISSELKIEYHEVDGDYKYNKLLIGNYQILSFPKDINFDIGIMIYLYQESYKVEIEVCNTKFATINNTSGLFAVIQTANTFGNFIHFNQCTIEEIIGLHLFYFTSSMWFYERHHQITFTNCVFKYNKFDTLLTVYGEVNIKLVGCVFRYNQLQFELIRMIESSHQNSMVVVNTSFYAITSNYNLMHISNVLLHLKGPVIFSKLKADSIFNTKHSTISCHRYIEFSENIMTYTDRIDYIIVQENTLINMTNNEYSTINEINLHYYDAHSVNNFTAPCYYQYTAEGQNFDDNLLEALNFSIVFHNDISIHTLMTAHCRWVHGSAFNITRPIDINKRLIKSRFPLYAKLVCYCFYENSQDCSIDTMATVFPGQTISLPLVLNYQYPTFAQYLTDADINYSHIITIEINDNVLPLTACKVAKVSEIIQKVHYSSCTVINLTVVHNGLSYLRWCELFINILSTHQADAYYIDILPCPAGFVYQNGICICDLILNSIILPITGCDINHQTILRPAGSWLFAVTINDSHKYSISPQCPLYYCLPQSSQLNFSTPNSQCQFNRSGLLCGQCQQGLSAVFGHSHCQRCSNVYLLLVIPIAVAGLVLVLLLFILNLTVTDGDINGFILYVNIISINDHVFFPRYNNPFNFLHAFISLANLDLGIPTCFYNGMDDYTKMWLQLAFPAYLILIATILIIASRHSTKIQRITARGALPVLATLFLLSYTKILRTVSSVLFYYSTITDLPSGHTKLVWAVDANVPLFGLKYSALFIICLFLFIILLPFNAILCFTKTAMRLQSVNHFKPLIDAYQGPYKYKYYYWTGLQLVIRAVFFGLSALNRSTNLTIGITILAAISIIQAKISPFKSEYKNINDLCFLYILLVIYIFSYGHNDVAIKIMIIMAALQFLLILIHHIISSICGGVIIYKMRNIADKIVQQITKLQVQNKPQQQELKNVPPDVAFDYSEYQEPLVGHD